MHPPRRSQGVLNRKNKPRAQYCSNVRRGCILLLIVLLAATLAWKTYDLQFTQAERITSWGEQQRMKTVYTLGVRGDILDRSEEILATSFPGADIFADPSLVSDPIEEARILSPVLDIPAELLEGKLASPGEFVLLKKRATPDLAEQVKALDLDGIATQESSRRHYPLGRAASEIVGFIGDYEQGVAGIEAIYEKQLLGTPGEMVQEQYPGGRSVPGGYSRIVPAVNGADVRLTIDRLIQYEAARILSEQVEEMDASGGVILISIPRTGEILSMVSVDRNDQGEVVTGLQNRSLNWVFEPGSVMKALTFSGVLDSGLATSETVISVPDRIIIHDSEFTDYSPHPVEDYTLREIVVESSNIGTIKWAQKLGENSLDAYLRAFGLGRSTSLGFQGESPGLLEQVRYWSGTSLPTIAIGQGVSVTPIQLLFAFNVIANGGLYVPPRLVAEILSADGEAFAPEASEAPRRVLSPETAHHMQQILRDVVVEGTGKRADVPNYESAGKTGTARKPLPLIGYGEDESEYKYVAAFAGFLPASAPELSILVVIDEPSATIYGGTAAAPAFKKIAETALRRLRIPPPQGNAEAEEAPEVMLVSSRNENG